MMVRRVGFGHRFTSTYKANLIGPPVESRVPVMAGPEVLG